MAVRGVVLLVLLVLGRLTCAEPVRVPSSSACPANSLMDSVFRFQALSCPSSGDPSIHSVDAVAVTEVDGVSLQRALGLVHSNSHNHIALLFYASWCSFSGSFRPTFSILSTMYPSIPHFAIEESVIKPSTLAKFRVRGFPTLLLLNSTMRVRYHGSRSLGSLATFYNDVTGLMTAPLDGKSLEGIQHSSDHEEKSSKLESYPFSWARSPENLIRQETYLALATAFVFLRLLYFIFSTLSVCSQWAYIQNTRLRSLWEHPLSYLNRAAQLFNSSKEPCRRSNLQDGALSAKAWASKSLASVSLGDASTSRGGPVN
ncbi:5'-adenylylsulfate reductase-like [Actinidia chinensis var. chinensis]|uniref:5'-adenylylsulfate reductase-like n=1 Tax=Actinidia chinensis var. chinensis TaxID=1590841 RepID=A0A2R6RNP1_ACTCC|nr:5'-adenylylsulfate reductase-like [Actinidia chinensis var. chinensis]